MTFTRSTKYFVFRHFYFPIFILLTILSLFILDAPENWSHQDTYVERVLGYYISPIMSVLVIIYTLYEWFKYRKLEVDLNKKLIKLNNRLIDISQVTNISRKYISLIDSYEYIFYETIPLEFQKIIQIPMFMVPKSKYNFNKNLEKFCADNKVKLEVKSNINFPK